MDNDRDGPARTWRGDESRRHFLRRAGTGATALSIGALAGCSDIPGMGDEYHRSQADYDPTIPSYDETYPGGAITTFRRGLRRLGYYPDADVPDAVTVDWARPINYIGHTAAKSSPRPTPDGEMVLVGADTGAVHAVTPQGRHRWTTQTGATHLGIHGTPTIVEGTAYIGGYDGRLYALEVETGELIWRTSRRALDGSIAIGSSPAYWDGVLFVVAEYNNPPSGALWVVDAATGDPLWSDHRPVGMPHPTPAIDPASERLVIGSNDGVCYCWEFPSLEPAWEFQTDGEIKGTCPVYDGAAFVGSWDGNLYRLALSDGTEEWSFETGGIVMSNPGVDPHAGVVYAGSSDNHVYALDAESGDLLWDRNVRGSIIGSLTVTPEVVLVGSYDTHLYALEKDTGVVRWRVKSRGHVTSEAVPHDGRIFYAERGEISGYYDDDAEEVVETPGHVYCLVPDE